jgi:NAD+ kinase
MSETDGVRKIKSVRIVVKTQSPKAMAGMRLVAGLIEKRGIDLLMDAPAARALGRRPGRHRADPDSAPADLYVVIGGDGTLLSVARSITSRPRPILGVNVGGLGFLTETSLEEMGDVLSEVLDGRYSVDRRMMLQVVLRRGGRTIARQTVLNDVVINKGALARIIDLQLTIDKKFVTIYKADGLIVSSPTGSTAYNLSAGGPIIDHSMEALLITPICPHTLTMRPLVVSARSLVEVALRTDKTETYLTLDGQVGHPLRAGDRIQVRRDRSQVLMVRSRRKNYFEVLRHKLRWGERRGI